MRKRTLGVVLVAGLAMSGAGAFTASNTFAGGTAAGYGSTAVTGATVTDVDYTLVTASRSHLLSVTFATTEDLRGSDVTLQLKNGASVVDAPNACVVNVTTGVTTVCTFTDVGGEALADFDSMNLLVIDSDTV